MFNFGKKKTSSDQVQLINALNRAQPASFTLNSSDLTGLLIEAIQLAKLVTTEQRDLEVIRNEYTLKSQYLEQKHTEIITMIEKEYEGRAQIIGAINARAEQLISSGQYDAAQVILNRMIDIIESGSPLRSAMELRNQRLLT